MSQASAVMQLGKSGTGLLQRALIAWQHASITFKLHTESIAQQKPISSTSFTLSQAVCTQALPCSTSMCTHSSMQTWAHVGSQPSWRSMHSTLAPIHAQCGTPPLRSYSTAGAEPPSSLGTGEGQGPPKELRMSLHEALVRLVDAAVEMVEAGHTDDAISVLKEGIATFEPNFPDSPELGELHNQVALLSLVAGDADSAAQHAATALAITQKHFSAGGPLVAHRQLRFGVANFAQGKLSEAAGLLHAALEALTAVKDTSASEASYYLTLAVLAGTRDVAKVANLEERLLSDIKEMKKTFGADAMIVSLALAQHDRIAHQPLGAAEPDGLLCEALLKQHARLLESVHPEGEDLAVAHYKLGTFYYVHDMLNDAQGYVRKAGTALRATLPEDHALVSMCKHRLGMVCSAQGDHRAATQLLEESQNKYGGGASEAEGGQATQTMSGLAREAQLGLAIAKYHALPPSSDASTKKDALKLVRARLDDLVAAIGVNHMLSRGAMRHVARLNAGAA